MAITAERFERLEDRVNKESERTNKLEAEIATIKTELRWIKMLLIGVFIEGGILIFQLSIQ